MLSDKKGGLAVASDCIFCKIVAGTIPAEVVYESKDILAFADVNPQAPTHILIIPKEHIKDFSSISKQQLTLLTGIGEAVQELAVKYELSNGYRLVNNCGADGGQSVAHLHFHLLGGRNLGWPPG